MNVCSYTHMSYTTYIYTYKYNIQNEYNIYIYTYIEWDIYMYVCMYIYGWYIYGI